MQNNRFSFLNSLTIRIFLFFWLTFLILLITILIFPTLDSRSYSELSEKEAIIYQHELAASIRTHQISNLLVQDKPAPIDSKSQLRPVLINSDGKIIGAMNADEEGVINQFLYNTPRTSTQLLKKNFYNKRIVGTFKLNLGEEHEKYAIVFIQKVNPQEETLNYIFDHPALLIVLLLLISSPLLYWLALTIGAPINKLQQAANAVALGNFKIQPELENRGVVELRQVGQSFNKMTQALDELISSQRELLSSISHELRTPLTRLKLSLALLRHRVGDNKEMQRIELESQRIEKMIEDLLQISRQQLDIYLIRETFTLPELWKEIIEDVEFEAEQMNIQFTFKQSISSPERYYLNGNHGQLASAIENILRNALKYTKSAISVHTKLSNSQLVINVDDNGSGLDPSEYEKIFQPFYRVDETRTRETGGIGLGLSIVSSVAQHHGGKVWASKSKLGGLRITFTLPLHLATKL